jgi:uncharacterized protein involved in outer membrane biogenesis
MALIKILKIAAAAIGVLLVLVVLFLWFTDFSKYQPDIEAAVSEATGREFRINGEFEVRVLPSPFVRMENVTLANAPWASGDNMLEIGHASVEVGLWSLLFQPIVIRDFQLRDVTVLAEANADEEFNWDIVPPDETEEEEEETSGSSSDELPAELRNVEISNVRVVYRQPESDDLVAVLDELTITGNESGGQNIAGNGQLGELAFMVSGNVDDTDTEIEGTIGDVRYSSRTRYENGALDVDISVGTLDALGKLIEVDNLPTEDLTVAGNIRSRGNSVILTDMIASVGPASVTANGEINGDDENARLALVAIADNFTFLSPELPELPFAGTAELQLAEGSLVLDPFEFTFGESNLAGSLRAEGGDMPSVNLQARSSLIDLRPFSADEEAEAADAQEAPADEGEDSRYVFKEEPLPLEDLRGFQADVDVTIDRVQMQTTYAESFKLVASANDGVLTLNNSFSGGRGGKYENEVKLDASGTSADLTINTLATDLKLGALSGGEVPSELVPASDLDLDIAASGSSPRQLAASANGKVLFTQGPGRVKNELIGKLSGDVIAQVFGALNPFAEDEEFSNWECTIFAIDFESGEGDISGFLLQGEKIMVLGGGKIDLNTEKLNVEFNTKPREGVGVSADMFVTPFVAVSGTLAQPGVGLNAKGAILSGGAAVLTGGLSFLYKGVMDRATAGADRCEETLAAVTGTAGTAEQ